ncbi:ABC transporter permease [Acuticoccus sp. MNP-M23]|uniref:ABC transporter permease n=1 Tax=Acuticoccus sp. MNP-M23 TaxID=3072793 RepID=UPI002815C329|nr:ABC transporter permease [Acuticoccus sp. MNP-M23]WMS44948.1 ABC transporter permease [Acuticoccus sp. MNP-M23]
MKSLRIFLSQNLGVLLAIAMFAVLYAFYVSQYPNWGMNVVLQNGNETLALILVGMAQTMAVIVGGLDLSVGPLMTLTNCFGSIVMAGTGGSIVAGIVACMALGTFCGFMNGCIIVYGRIQPIIATLATGAIFLGLALLLRPSPGGSIDGDFAWAFTNDINELGLTYGWWEDLGFFGQIPLQPIYLILIVVCVWIPYKRSVTGRGAYAIGSNPHAAYMSGVRMDRSKIAAFTLAGFFAGCAGIYLTMQMGSGNADAPQAAEYTLRSIATVVIGGTSLYGGTGGVIGTIFGALVLRSISFIFRVVPESAPLGFVASPLLQPFFEGLILLVAVSLGAARVFRVKNRLSLFS